jgi:lipopolysaccharide exporter
MICVMLGGVVLSVLFPTFSKMQSDRQRIKKAYLRALEYISFVGILANTGLLAVSKEFLYFVLGRGTDKWLPALVSLRILCIYGILRLLLEPVGSVILAIGKSGPLLRAQIIMAAVELVLLYPALHFFGIEGVAVAVTVSYVLAFAALFPLLRKELGLRLEEWIAPALPAAGSAIIAVVALGVVQGFIPFTFAGMAAKVLILLCIYVATYGMITKWKIVGEIIDIVSEFRARAG